MSQNEPHFLPPDSSALEAEQESLPTEPSMGPVGDILGAHREALMGRRGVVMVGETLDALGRPAILIGVKTARDLASLPSEVEGIPVVVQVIGEVDAYS